MDHQHYIISINPIRPIDEAGRGTYTETMIRGICRLVVLMAILLSGCATPPNSDVRTHTRPPKNSIENPSALIDNPPTSSGALKGEAADDPRPRGVVMDAMVGQVNGQPIYSATIFKEIDEQLRTILGQLAELQNIGRQAHKVVATRNYRIFNGRLLLGTTQRALSPPEQVLQTILNQAIQLIAKQLDQIIDEQLLVGEAERDLSDQEVIALRNILQEMREEMIRTLGEGMLSVTQERLRQSAGISLEEKMEQTRQELLVQRFLRRKLSPKIIVSRRNIERFYEDAKNDKLFRPASGRILRLIRVSTQSKADEVDDQLNRGQPFQEVATLHLNNFKSSEGGLWSSTPTPQDNLFNDVVLNQAMIKLKPGQWSPRIAIKGNFWWVYLESWVEAHPRPLREVQVEIDRRLREQQFRMLTMQYYDELRRDGSYDAPQAMAADLLEVALNQYGPTQ